MVSESVTFSLGQFSIQRGNVRKKSSQINIKYLNSQLGKNHPSQNPKPMSNDIFEYDKNQEWNFLSFIQEGVSS